MIAMAKVFEKDGNRFLIPGIWYTGGDDNAEGCLSAISNALMYSVVCGLKEEPGWMEIQADETGKADFVHVPQFIAGSGFAHGGFTVFLISGPIFDAAQEAEATTRAEDRVNQRENDRADRERNYGERF